MFSINEDKLQETEQDEVRFSIKILKLKILL
jgi:hypothetical protein